MALTSRPLRQRKAQISSSVTSSTKTDWEDLPLRHVGPKDQRQSGRRHVQAALGGGVAVPLVEGAFGHSLFTDSNDQRGQDPARGGRPRAAAVTAQETRRWVGWHVVGDAPRDSSGADP